MTASHTVKEKGSKPLISQPLLVAQEAPEPGVVVSELAADV